MSPDLIIRRRTFEESKLTLLSLSDSVLRLTADYLRRMTGEAVFIRDFLQQPERFPPLHPAFHFE